LGSECRNLSLRRNPHHDLGHIAQGGQLRKQIGEAGRNRCEPGAFIDPPKSIGVNRPNPAFPIKRKKFRLVRSHVRIDWTIPFATFARQTKV